MREVISAARTKKAPIPAKALTRKWPVTTPHLMSNLKPMPRARFPNGRAWSAQLRRLRRDSQTFLSAFSESNGLQRSPRQLRPAVVFNKSMSIQRAMNSSLALRQLAIAQPFEIYVRQSEENFRSYVTQDWQQAGSQRGETRAPRGAARERPSRRIQRRA